MDKSDTHSPNLPFLTARKIGNQAINDALNFMKAISVCVVNRQGQVIFLAIMDGVAPATESVATLKAKQAAHTGKRTSVTITQVNSGEITPEVLGIDPRKLMPYKGGVPIYSVKGELLGGLGISGLTQDEDEEFAIGAVATGEVGECLFSEKLQR